MAQADMKSGQGEGDAPANANQLVAKIKSTLTDAGVEFKGDVEVTDVLAAALDCIEACRTQAEQVMRGRVYGTVRGAVIAATQRDYESDKGLKIMTCAEYVDGALREQGLALLTADEKLELPAHSLAAVGRFPWGG